MFGLLTVKDGERVAIWNRAGECRLVDGPRRLFLLDETVEPLPRHAAGPGRYLVVTHRDGVVEHLPGPVSVFFDPVRHASIEERGAIAVDSNEALVVYRREGEAVTRRVVRGPRTFTPAADEWLHEFRWHGADPKHPSRKIPGALRFTRVRVIPDQMYLDVEEVRTVDDALLVVKLMIFFELTDVERMLDRTHDAVADFMNAATADIIDFAAGLPFERFKERTEALNDLATYPHLTARAQTIGYRIAKVVYRGYLAGAKLQSMHDEAIEARTRLRLESETEAQAQRIEDEKLGREAERQRMRQEMDRREAAHALEVERMRHEEEMRRAAERLEAELSAQRKRTGDALAREEAEHREKHRFYETMRALDIDLTRYLVAQYQHPDRLIRIANDAAAQVHVHE